MLEEPDRDETSCYHYHIISTAVKQRIDALEIRLEELEDEVRKLRRRRKK